MWWTARTTSGWVASRGRGTARRTSSRTRAGPLGEHEHAVGELRRLLDVVGHEHDRARLLAQQPRQLAAHAEAGQVVEGREGLVHEQQVGVAGQGPRQLHALPHAARELVRVVLLEAVEARSGRAGSRRGAAARGAPGT